MIGKQMPKGERLAASAHAVAARKGEGDRATAKAVDRDLAAPPTEQRGMFSGDPVAVGTDNGPMPRASRDTSATPTNTIAFMQIDHISHVKWMRTTTAVAAIAKYFQLTNILFEEFGTNDLGATARTTAQIDATYAFNVALLVLLPSCTSAGSIAGAVAGAASGTGSANPALGYAVGIRTTAAFDAQSHYVPDRRQEAERDQIATAVGTLPVGQTVAWRIKHKVPLFDDRHVYVTVVRDIPIELTPCKEVVFTILVGKNTGGPCGHYVTTACEQDTR